MRYALASNFSPLELQEIDKRTEPSDRLRKAVPFEGSEQFRSGLWRVAETFPLAFDRGANGAGSQVEKVNQEVIRMPCLDVESGQRGCGKVREVAGDDHLGPGPYGGRKHMAVVGIGQRKGSDQVLVAGNQAIPNRLVHERARSGQALRQELRVIFEDISDPFVMDLLGPVGMNQARLGQPDQKVAER